MICGICKYSFPYSERKSKICSACNAVKVGYWDGILLDDEGEVFINGVKGVVSDGWFLAYHRKRKNEVRIE